MSPGPSDDGRSHDARSDDGASGEQTLGAALRSAREQAGRSVEQVSSDTRIRGTLIRDLENDHFVTSGGSVYARGHVKAIASSLRVDPGPLLALFDRAQGPVTPLVVDATPVAHVVTSFGGSAFAASAAASLTPERRGPRWGLAGAGAAAVLVGLVTVGYLSSSGGSSPTNLGASQPTGAPTTTPPAAVRPPAPDAVASKPPVTGAQLRLRVIGTPSWVSVSNASTTLFEGVLSDGMFKDFTDPNRLKVVIGNALSVSLNCGGKDSGPAGASGAVRRFECTSTGLTAL